MKKIFYQHIVKTGGQTLATRIASAFPIGRSEFIRPGLVFPEGVRELGALFEKCDFVECHVRGRVLASFNDLDILVTARNPIKQIVSNYFHIRREPRSDLYYPVNKLRPDLFFEKYGDFFSNIQARSFVMGYLDLEKVADSQESLVNAMIDCLERVRWFVPTESIDEFCALWQIETQRRMALPEKEVNIAETDEFEVNRVESIVRSCESLYSVDLLFWQIVWQKYNKYRIGVMDRVIGGVFKNNWGLVYSDGEFGIWLGRGWYQPQVESGRIVIWGGPSRKSDIHFRRNCNHVYLIFTVVVFCGILQGEIQFFDANGAEIPLLSFKKANGEVVYAVSLERMEVNGFMQLVLPRSWSPAMVDRNSLDFERRTVAAAEWCLVDKLPSELLDN